MTDTGTANFRERIVAGDRLYGAGRLREAAAIYRQILKDRTVAAGELASGFTSYDAYVLERLADLEIRLERNAEAHLLLSSLQDILQANQNIVVWVSIVLKRCELYLVEGDVDSAFLRLNDFREVTGDVRGIDFRDPGVWVARCALSRRPAADQAILFPRLFYVMGRILMELGQYRDALAALDYGYTQFAMEGSVVNETLLCSFPLARAQASLEQGDLPAAREWIGRVEKALATAEVVTLLELRARLELLSGELGAAVVTLKQACEWYRAQGLLQGTLASLLNLAHVRIYLNQVWAAEQLLDEALALADSGQGGDVWPQRIENLRSLARLRASSPTRTVSVIPALISIRQRPVDGAGARGASGAAAPGVVGERGADDWRVGDRQAGYLVRYEERALRFQYLLGGGDWVKAAVELELLQQAYLATDSLLIRHRMVVLDFLLHYYEGGAVDVGDLRQSCGYFEAQGLLPELWQAQRFLSWAPAADPEARKLLVENNQQLLDGLSRSLPADQQAVFLLNKWTAEEEYLNQQVAGLVACHERASRAGFLRRPWLAIRTFMGITRLLAAMDAHRDKIRVEALQLTPAGGLAKTGLSLLWHVLRHPWRRLSLSFLVLPDKTVVVRRRRFRIGVKVVSANRMQLRRWVEDWHRYSAEDLESIDISSAERKQRLGNLSATIAEAIGLTAILDTLPPKVDRLTIVADDALGGFPWGSVYYREAWLVERMAVSLAFRSLAVGSPNNGRARHSGKRLPDALCAYVAKGGTGFSPLPGAVEEAEMVQGLIRSQYRFGQVLLYPDEKVTVETISAAAAHCRLLHIACHGHFDRHDPGESGLVLAEGCRLTVRQIAASAAFAAVDHLTLSACWSADLFILPGRWIISIPEALSAAGVQSILGSFWQVDDGVARSLMKAFYTYAATSPRDIALQRCQIDAIRGNLPDCMEDTSNPLYWSGFLMYGVGRTFQ